jgi:signal transduction histidine kinase
MLIRNRLTLIFTILATGIQLVLSLLAWYFYSLYRQQEFYARLEDKALVTGRVLISRRHLHDDFFKNMLRTDLLTIVDEQISIWDHTGQLVFTNRTLTNTSLFKDKINLISPDTPIRFRSGRLEAIGMLYTDQEQSFYIFAAGYDRLGLSKLSSLQHILPLINLIGFALIVLAGWYFSSRALAPITHIITEVETITAKHLNKRVNEGNRKDEIAQLAMTFNQMLFRLEDAFKSQRSFVSNASHELRTPLTNILGTLETSLRYDNRPDDLRQSIGLSIEELKKVIALTNSMLSLAKATDDGMVLSAVQVDDCLLTAIGQKQRKYPERTISIQFPDDTEEEFTVRGSAALLTTAFINVLDNACKYSTELVLVKLAVTDDQIVVQVTDKGRGIAQEDTSRIYEPLFRGNNVTGVPGYGIGLSVTQKIVDLHSGKLMISSVLNQGTTVTIQLPQIISLQKNTPD